MSAFGVAIDLRGVTKTFGGMTAVANLDLSIPRGGLYGFIGPNGAGKTTSIRIIMSILFPDSGELTVLGHASALDAKDKIGYMPEERGVYRKMRVGAYLAYIARLKGAPIKASRSASASSSRASASRASRASAARSSRKACSRRSSSSRPSSTSPSS